MKKISLLKKLSLAAVSIAAISPFALTATSCSKKSAILVRYVSYNTVADHLDDAKLDVLETGHFTNNELLLGTKKFNNGNYILFIASNANDNPLKFFGGASCTERNADKWFESNDFVKASYWFNDIMQTNAIIRSKLDRDFGLVTFIDNFDHKFYDTKGHQIYVTEKADDGLLGAMENVSPFKKWTGEIITQTKILNKHLTGDLKYEWDDESVEADKDYIRQDDQAKAYRKLMELGAAMFPVVQDKRATTFDTSDACNPQMVIYKDGRLMDIVSLPTTAANNPTEETKETGTLFGTINKYFTPEEEEESK